MTSVGTFFNKLLSDNVLEFAAEVKVGQELQAGLDELLSSVPRPARKSNDRPRQAQPSLS